MNKNASSASTRNLFRSVGTATPDIPIRGFRKILPGGHTISTRCPLCAKRGNVGTSVSTNVLFPRPGHGSPFTAIVRAGSVTPTKSSTRFLFPDKSCCGVDVTHCPVYSTVRTTLAIYIRITTVFALPTIIYATGYHRNLRKYQCSPQDPRRANRQVGSL